MLPTSSELAGRHLSLVSGFIYKYLKLPLAAAAEPVTVGTEFDLSGQASSREAEPVTAESAIAD